MTFPPLLLRRQTGCRDKRIISKQGSSDLDGLAENAHLHGCQVQFRCSASLLSVCYTSKRLVQRLASPWKASPKWINLGSSSSSPFFVDCKKLSSLSPLFWCWFPDRKIVLQQQRRLLSQLDVTKDLFPGQNAIPGILVRGTTKKSDGSRRNRRRYYDEANVLVSQILQLNNPFKKKLLPWLCPNKKGTYYYYIWRDFHPGLHHPHIDNNNLLKIFFVCC